MKQYWQSLDEYKSQVKARESGEAPAKKERQPEFNLEGLEEESKMTHNRRDFLKMLGFTVGYAALATSCETPVRKAIPYLYQPEEITPGVANYYASTFYDGRDYCSILVKTREGRPIKIEGNALSPVTKGGTTARVQASVLNLYDQARIQEPLKDKNPVSWDSIDIEIGKRLDEVAANDEKIVLLTGSIISPSTKKLIAEFQEKYPTTEWVTYDNISSSAMLAANEMNFGKKALPSYHFCKAKLVVGFNADFQGNWLMPVTFTKQFSSGRKLADGETEMSKHIQYESYMSLTGSNADYRVNIKPSEEAVVLLNLYNEIAAKRGAPVFNVAPTSIDVITLADEMLKNEGKTLIVSGTNDLGIQLTVNAINQLLGSYGETIDFSKTLNIRQAVDADMDKLVNEMNEGIVGALLSYQVNPVYDYNDPEKFLGGMKKVGLTVSFAERLDETASLCQYVCPDNNYLESWNDTEVISGQFSMMQPAISKIFNTRQFQESLLKFTGKEPDYYAYLQKFWEEVQFPAQSQFASFKNFWNQCVHDGIFATEAMQGDQPEYIPAELKADAASGDGFELVLYEKIGIGTGTHANNPWLQELPDPISMATWDNYVCINTRYAEEHGIEDEDVVSINGEFELPVLVQPGQPYDTIAIAVGYGRSSAGRVANGIGKNVFQLSKMADGHCNTLGTFVDMKVVAGKSYPLARTQASHTMEGRALVRETSLDEWKEDPKSGNEMHMDIVNQNLTLYDIPSFDAFHWGMAINLNACTGCSSCVISCQAENNVAVIGKEQVKNRRIMHWIRMDRYYSEEAENPEVSHMPVMCQHCDNAPCENVCPVAATPHSDEGLNQMAYNRCIGTRYCMNNCPYKVRRFNWFEYSDNPDFDYNFSNEQEKLVLNPDVTVRSRGVVEKCSLCVQRIQEQKLIAKKEGREIQDGDVKTACQQSCPGDAIVFGNMNDPESEISKLVNNPRTYQLLEQIHTLPSVNYVTKIRNKEPDDLARTYSRNYPVYGEDDGSHDGHSDNGHGHENEH